MKSEILIKHKKEDTDPDRIFINKTSIHASLVSEVLINKRIFTTPEKIAACIITFPAILFYWKMIKLMSAPFYEITVVAKSGKMYKERFSDDSYYECKKRFEVITNIFLSYNKRQDIITTVPYLRDYLWKNY